jgi:methyl-accepting chemotaxis protein
LKGHLVKNLKLSMKVGILVAVLLATTLTVAIVGVRQLSHLSAAFDEMVDTTGRATIVAAEGRAELMASIRFEKNSVIIQDKIKGAEFAAEARKHLDRAKELRNDLSKLVGANVATPEGKAMSDLDRALQEFEINQKEVLRLAVIKSVLDGTVLLYGDFFRRAQDAQEFIDSLGEAVSGVPPATGTAATADQQRTKQVAGQQMLGRYYDLLFHAAVHLNSSDEREMNALDAEMRQLLVALQESVRRFSATLNESERFRSASILSSIESIKPDLARFQEFSHVNSGHYAAILTTTKTVEVGNHCEDAIVALLTALSDRLGNDRRDVSASAELARNLVLSTGVIGTLISLILAVVTIRSITRPAEEGVKIFESMASGDLTRRMNLDRHDEIGRLGAASDQMAASLCGVVTQIRSFARSLGDSAGQLSGVSTDLLSQSQQMATQAESVAAGTEQMATNVSTMAAAAEEMSVNVSGISSASEEVSVNVASIVESASATSRSVGSVAESIGHITSSLQDVAKDARHGSQMTKQAKDMAAAATTAMRQLDQAASEITKVTEVIKSIALQTNLLALNATIEATSAGEAGKGFAVVASEVKELASQSAHSAEEIARKIESVQTSTRDAVKVIENVAQFVDQVNVSAGRISESVDGQTQTASQIVAAVAEARHGVESIARSIAEVAKGATDVSRNTAEAATAATDVSRNASEAAKASETISSNIHGVSDATKLNNASAVKVNDAARQLKEIAVQLQRSVSRFNVGDEKTA